MTTMPQPPKKEIKVAAVASGLGGLNQISNRAFLEQRYEEDPMERGWLDEALEKCKEHFDSDVAAGLNDVLPPPALFTRLEEIVDESPALVKNINSMVNNVGGLGHQLKPLVDIREDADNEIWKLMQQEKRRLDSFFENLCLEHTTDDVFEMLVRHLETFGNAYWEVIRAANGRVLGINPIEDPKRMRLTRRDPQPHKYLHRSRIGTEYEEVLAERRFRKFVLLEPGGKKRYFRQYGDNRPMDSRTGKYGNYQTIPMGHRANEIMHFKLPHTSSEYGVVRWISVMIDAVCTRVAKLCNHDVLDNSGTPPLAIVASGTDDENFETRVRDQLVKIQQEGARTKVMIVTLPPSEAGTGEGEKIVQPKLEFIPLGHLLIQEGMFLDFMRYSDAEIRSIFRIPPLLLGDLEETPNKSTAEEAVKIAERQVFGPARKKIESQINRLLLDNIIPNRAEKGVMFWEFKLNALATDQSEMLLSVIEAATTSAGLTPNQVNALVRALLPDHKLEALPDDPRNDVPLAFQQLASKPAEGLRVRPVEGEEADETRRMLRRVFGAPVDIVEVELHDRDPYAA